MKTRVSGVSKYFRALILLFAACASFGLWAQEIPYHIYELQDFSSKGTGTVTMSSTSTVMVTELNEYPACLSRSAFNTSFVSRMRWRCWPATAIGTGWQSPDCHCERSSHYKDKRLRRFCQSGDWQPNSSASDNILHNTSEHRPERVSIIDTLRVPIDLYSVANMYIYPHGDPLATFIMYGTPPSGTYDLVGDGYSFNYACNTSSRAYYSIPILDGHAGYSLNSVTFKVYQANCYGNFESHTFPIWHDGEPYFMMLAHVQYDLPFEGSSYFPDSVQNLGVLSDDNTVGWRELDVTNAYKYALGNGWQHLQLMLYFEILTDWDYAQDCVLMLNPNHLQYAPHLIATYAKDVSNSVSIYSPRINSVSVYPNPFSAKATLKSDQHNPIDNIEMYNLRGQRIRDIAMVRQTQTEWIIEINQKC